MSVDIQSLSVLEGNFPPRALGLVIEWASLHKNELLENWNIARQQQAPKKIKPLN